MKHYFAPMEGLTGYVYRNAHHAFFNNIDKYFSPFVAANKSGSFRKRELDDLAPENNQGLILIPQILTNNAKDFILMADKIRLMGYDEINLNLGCPSGTVVSKNKGAGFLSVPSELDKFLYEIFSWGGTKISIKTRIGIDKSDEFEDLLGIFNKYPIQELTIHPRVQKDFYKNKPNLEAFKYALSWSKAPLCYNGDINTIDGYHKFIAQFPEVDSVMIGRGLLINPGLTKEIRSSVKLDKNLLREFHDKIYSDYKRVLSGDVNVLYKMKELWTFIILLFSNHEKCLKKIKKSARLRDYEDAVSSLFREQEILEDYKVILNNNFSKV